MKSKYDRNYNFYLCLFKLKTAVDDSDDIFFKQVSKQAKEKFIYKSYNNF